jgi:hypothetical protein
VSENAKIEPRPDATASLAVRRSNQYTTRLNLIHTWQDLTHTRLDLTHTRLDLIHTRLDLTHTRLDLIHTRPDLIHCILVRYCDEQFLKAEMAEAVHLTPVQFDVAAGQLLQVRVQYAGNGNAHGC